MPFIDDDEIEKVRKEFLRNVDRSAIAGTAGIDEKPRFVWRGGLSPYKGFDDREYQSHPPCLSPSFTSTPTFEKVCLYHFKFSASGKLSSKYFEEPLSYEDGKLYDAVDEKVKKWIRTGQTGSGQTVTSTHPDDREWGAPCIVCVYMENPDWELIDLDPDDPGQESFSLHFHDITVRDRVSGKKIRGTFFHRNYSFFNAMNHDLGNGTRYLSVENHLNESHYRFKPNRRYPRRRQSVEIDHYKFDIFYRVNVDTPTHSAKKSLIVVIDPGGRNTGP